MSDRGDRESPVWAVGRFALRSALAGRRRTLQSLGRGRTPAPTAKWSQQPHRPAETIVVGDSIVQRFPAELLARLTEDPVMNHGWGGDTVADVASRIAVTICRTPRTLILQVGTNDVLRGRPLTASLETYHRLVSTAASGLPGAEIAICALPPVARWRAKPSAVHEFNDRLQEIARSLGAGYIDVFTPLSSDAGTPRAQLTTDGVHLSPDGYVAYASQLSRVLGKA